MSITFTSKEEASEYSNQKQKEGYQTYTIKKDNSYKVHILGKIINIPIKITKVKSFTHKENLGESSQGGEIQITPEASKTVTLHEIGHVKLGHALSKNPIEAANDEISAQIYAYDKMERPITFRVAIPALGVLKYNWDMDKEERAHLVKELLKDKGIIITKEEYSELLTYE